MEKITKKEDPKSGETKLLSPDILQYTNYRLFLRDYYDYKKQTSQAFSLRFFAAKAGLASHAHLKLAIDGKRNLTKNTVVKLISALNLDEKRANYFENLVFFNQAKTEKEKHTYYSLLVKSSPKSKLHQLEKTQFRIFKEWYHSVILEMISLKDFNPAPEWVSRKLNKLVSPAQVSESFKLLQELNLIVKTAKGYRRQETLITTSDEVQDLMVKYYHYAMLKLAGSAISNLSPESRDISALTFPIKRSDFPALKKHIQLMRKELLNFEAKVGDAEDVIQVNIQLFPLTRGS